MSTSEKSSSMLGPGFHQESADYAKETLPGARACRPFALLVQQAAFRGDGDHRTVPHTCPASVLCDASHYFDVPIERICAMVGLPVSSGQPRRLQENLDAHACERVRQMADITALAIELFEDEAAAIAWLTRPNRTFLHLAPFDFLDTEQGSRSVRQVLTAMATGAPA